MGGLFRFEKHCGVGEIMRPRISGELARDVHGGHTDYRAHRMVMYAV